MIVIIKLVKNSVEALGRSLTSAKVQIVVELSKHRGCNEGAPSMMALTDFFITKHRQSIVDVLRLFKFF